MAFQAGRVTTFTIDDSGGTPRDLSAYTTDASLTLTGSTLETTTLGATGDAQTYIRGLNGGSFTASGFYDPTATTGPDDVLEGLYDAATAGTFSISFDGGTTTYSGESFCTNFSTSASVGGVAGWNASFTVTGQTSRA